MAFSFSPDTFQRIKGRGAFTNPPNRFEPFYYLPDPGAVESETIKTQVFRDTSKSIISSNDSPDVGFDYSINPYRGCEHGCIYCYARPTHEYLGFSSGLDFESKIVVKEDAAKLLRITFLSKKWKPQVLALSGVTDPYQPLEKKLKVTRSVLEVLTEFLNPVTIVTKSFLVTRDIDLLRELARARAVAVGVSITTLDGGLQRYLEPRAASADRRLAAIEMLARADIPVRVLISPVVPALNDHEIPSILQAASRAGAYGAEYMFLRLPGQLKDLFENWLDTHFPSKKKRILNQLRSLRSGQLNDPRFHFRMKGEGEYARQVQSLFKNSCRRFDLNKVPLTLSTESYRRPHRFQMSLFD